MSGREKYCDLPKVDAAVQIEFIFFYTNLLNERMAAIFKENSFIRFFTTYQISVILHIFLKMKVIFMLLSIKSL